MNEKLFTDLFYGNYAPNEDIGHSEDSKECANKIDALKDKILDKIKDDNLQSLFLEYDELLTEAIDIYSHDAYIEGVKFATNFLFNSLSSNNSVKK